MSSKSFSLLVLCLPVLLACAPMRAPVPPGTIPSSQAVSPSDENYGRQVLNELKKQYPVSDSTGKNNRARSIVRRLATAADADQEPWSVYVLEGDDTLNAAATRGNHVFVWTGLMDLAASDDELAAVLGHEIAHVLAQHTMPTPVEQVNQVLVGTAGAATSSVIGGAAGALGGNLASMLAQAILVNPQSQRLELEADHIGLFIMARAGYDPNAAITLWKKMSQRSGGGSAGTLAFLSTHPPNEERIEQLEALIPQARQQAKQKRTSRASDSLFTFNVDDPRYQPSKKKTHASGAY